MLPLLSQCKWEEPIPDPNEGNEVERSSEHKTRNNKQPTNHKEQSCGYLGTKYKMS